MAEMWYYTSEGKQMEPVTIADLKQLAASGLLKPTDLVWTEGMAKWTRASSTGELFSEDSPIPRAGGSPQRDTSQEERSDRLRRGSRRDAGRHEEDEEDERPRRRRRRLAEDAGMPMGLKVGLILGGTFLAIIVIVVIVMVAVRPGAPLAKIKPPPPVNFNVPGVNNGPLLNTAFTVNLQPNNKSARPFQFKAGTTYLVSGRCTTPNPNFSLSILDSNNASVAARTSIGTNAIVTFVAPQSGPYNVEVLNRGALAGDVAVTVRELRTGFQPVPADPNLPQPPSFMGPVNVGQGGLVVTDQLTFNDNRLPARNWICKVVAVNMVKGKTYTIREESNQIDSYLFVQDSKFIHLAEDDDGGGNLNAQIFFSPPETGVYRVIASSLGSRPGAFTLKITEQ